MIGWSTSGERRRLDPGEQRSLDTLAAYPVLRLAPLTRPALVTSLVAAASLGRRRVLDFRSFIVEGTPWDPPLDEPFSVPVLDAAAEFDVGESLAVRLLGHEKGPGGMRAIRDQLRHTPWLTIDERVARRVRERFALDGVNAQDLAVRVAAAAGVRAGRPRAVPHLADFEIETYSVLARTKLNGKIGGSPGTWMSLRSVSRRASRKRKQLDAIGAHAQSFLLTPELAWNDMASRSALIEVDEVERRVALALPPLGSLQRQEVLGALGYDDRRVTWATAEWCRPLASSVSDALGDWFEDHAIALASWGFVPPVRAPVRRR